MIRVAALGVLVAALSSLHATAADPITVSTSAAADMPVFGSPAFDWNGFYAGIYAGGQSGPRSSNQYGLGIQAGVNTQFDFYLFGAEVAVHGLSDSGGEIGNNAYGQILGRAGLVVTDNVLLYAAGGYGIDLGSSDRGDLLVGGGLELVVDDAVTLDAQYLYGTPLEGGESNHQVTFGANFHF